MVAANNSIEAKMQDQEKLGQALASGVKAAIERHRRLGERIAILRDGKPVLVSVEEAQLTFKQSPTPH